MTNDARWSYTWDAENRLVRVLSPPASPSGSHRRVEWTYEAKGRRIGQKTSLWTDSTWVVIEELKFISDPMSVGRHIAELNATDNTLVRSYVWGLDLSGSLDGAGGVGGLLWVRQHSGSAAGVHFCAYDGNGNVVALSAASNGSETARYEYGPFGEQIRATGPMAKENPFRFSTKRTDNTTDFVLYEYRVYNPTLGRWLSRDPIEEEGGLNVYGFVDNSPGDDWDWLGLCGCTCKSVSVTFIPGGKKPKVDFYPQQDVFGTFYRFGFVVVIEWTVDGDPNKCKYFLYEPAGGVTGKGPKGKYRPSPEIPWIEVPRVVLDALGLPVNQGMGKYKIKVDLIQQYKCRSSDGTEVTDSKHIKISKSKKWKGPPKGK